jgi:hypothetical protein
MQPGAEHVGAMRRGHDLVIRRIRPIMIAMGTIALCLVLAAFTLDEGEIVTLVSLDANGMEHETQLWFVRLDGVQYLRASSASVEWLGRVTNRPQITVERNGVRALFEASPSGDAIVRAKVNRAMAKKYGLADRVWALISDRSGAVPIRLEPGPADVEPLRERPLHGAGASP